MAKNRFGMAFGASPFSRIAFGLLVLTSLLGCSRRAAGFEGAWAFCLNGRSGIERYLFVSRAGSGYLVALADRARGELEGIGEAESSGGRLKTRMDGGILLDLELNGENELRAAMRKANQSEDLTLVFYRADGAAGGARAPAVGGAPPAGNRHEDGLVVADPNVYGGKTYRVDMPDSPDTRYVELARDDGGRLRERRLGYPEAFLKEDPRIEGRFLYDTTGRLTTAEYRFSESFAAAHKGLSLQRLVFSADGAVEETELVYDGRDPSLPRIVRGAGPPGELP